MYTHLYRASNKLSVLENDQINESDELHYNLKVFPLQNIKTFWIKYNMYLLQCLNVFRTFL